MDQAQQTIDKWRRWLDYDLWISVKNMLVSRTIFVAFSNNLIKGEDTREQDIVFWIVWNYYESACMTIRRMCDKDLKSRSLMALLQNMRSNLDCFPRMDWKSLDPTFKKTNSEVMNDFSSLLDRNISQLESFTKDVDEFATKHIAHIDKNRTSYLPIDINELLIATESVHAIYRMYARMFLGLKPYNIEQHDESDFHDGSVAIYEEACRNIFDSRYFESKVEP